jgi:ABC-type Fe3+-siderophore transport system permease subunit
MTWGKALVYVSSFSYLGAVATSLGGYPLMTSIHPVSQAIFFLLAFVLLLSSLKMRKMKWVLSAFYGIAAILSFSGLTSWASYFGGPGTLGPAMAAWDLVLAIALLLD